MSEAFTPMLDVTELVEETGGDTVRMCYQCGTCSASCPHNQVSDFRTRDVIRRAQMGLESEDEEALWRCTTCKLCVDRCPREVGITEVIVAARSIMNEAGTIPQTLRSMLGSVKSNHNPWSGEHSERRAWTKDRPLPLYEPGMDFLLFQCCTMSYDPRSTKTGRALIRLLDLAGVTYGVLADERCCGESVCKVGHRDLFEALRDSNQGGMEASGARRILTTSPHCMDTFVADYELDDEVEVVHVTTLLRQLIEEGRLQLTEPIEERVTYHDPCYLGRYQGVYDDPREVLRAIPGLELVEMKNHREESLCCGGGGGGMWAERPPEERLSVVRWKQADAVEAKTIATACPYCTLMLEDGKLVLGREDEHHVLDIIELVDRAVAG